VKDIGVRALMKKLNESLDTPKNWRITRQKLHDAIQASLLKASVTQSHHGQPHIIPEDLTRSIAMHTIMMQVSGESKVLNTS
jgi:hypothetical protein